MKQATKATRNPTKNTKTVRKQTAKTKKIVSDPVAPASLNTKKPRHLSLNFPKVFVISTVLVLLGTTLLWSILSAKLQQVNADQIINSYLFENSKTFHGAVFPSSHSFLFKWPLFFLVSLVGISSFSLILFTVLVTLFTVGFFIFVLSRIERRPLYFGAICLALASVLLLVPAQPYAGGLLPVNMAMITTRNLEYIFYVTTLVLLISAPRLRNRNFLLATLLLVLLFASDRLFLTLSIGGAGLALIYYSLVNKNREMAVQSKRWLISSVVAALGALLLLRLINWSGLTHIANNAGSGPFGFFRGLKDFILGCLYSIMGLFTNFGANPAFDATIVRNIPAELSRQLLSTGVVTYVINAAILAGAFFTSLKILFSKTSQNKKTIDLSRSSILALMLIWSTLLAFAEFILTHHYYSVDSRYLTVAVFSGFISIAVFLRSKIFRERNLIIASFILFLGILIGISNIVHIFKDQRGALSDFDQRDSRISAALSRHPVDAFIGDYWRVLPVKLKTKTRLNILPMYDCGQVQSVLSSSAWRVNPKKSFAYLISYDKSLTGYRNCSLEQVFSTYGRPNSSTLIEGSLKNPKEQLLFYDNGINKIKLSTAAKRSNSPATVSPISIKNISDTLCPKNTIINVVAHEDDDLLFINPDTLNDIKSGNCIRTIYVTAGDAGNNQLYWLSRELGSEAAYSSMAGNINEHWDKQIVEVSKNEFVRIDSPSNNSKISLIFFRLPDGNVNGSGFSSNNYEGLAKLESGEIKAIHSVDGQSTFNNQQLVESLITFMKIYQPTEIRTQANFISNRFPDHSDHIAVGRFTKKAFTTYENRLADLETSTLLKFYIGYPIHEMAPNITQSEIDVKEAAFLNYAKFDGAVCSSIEQCNQSILYGSYLSRQYQNSD